MFNFIKKVFGKNDRTPDIIKMYTYITIGFRFKNSDDSYFYLYQGQRLSTLSYYREVKFTDELEMIVLNGDIKVNTCMKNSIQISYVDKDFNIKSEVINITNIVAATVDSRTKNKNTVNTKFQTEHLSVESVRVICEKDKPDSEATFPKFIDEVRCMDVIKTRRYGTPLIDNDRTEYLSIECDTFQIASIDTNNQLFVNIIRDKDNPFIQERVYIGDIINPVIVERNGVEYN